MHLGQRRDIISACQRKSDLRVNSEVRAILHGETRNVRERLLLGKKSVGSGDSQEVEDTAQFQWVPKSRLNRAGTVREPCRNRAGTVTKTLSKTVRLEKEASSSTAVTRNWNVDRRHDIVPSTALDGVSVRVNTVVVKMK